MGKRAMTSAERVAVALAHGEPDRVPLFLALTMHGALELGLPLREYFSSARHVVEGQLRLRRRYGHDILYAFFYAALEVEAWGGEVLFHDDGPPTAGAPIVRSRAEIFRLEPPRIEDSPRLEEVLQTIRRLCEAAAGEVPVLGVVISPFSLPVMQMGFDRYLDLLHADPEAFHRLMAVNRAFCVEWANAQLAAGAAAVGYFDPLASPNMIPRDRYLALGHPVDRATVAAIRGPVIVHLASGISLPVIEDLVATGAAGVGVSAHDDLARVKQACSGRLTVVGNLDGITMRRWTPAAARRAVEAVL